MIWSRSLHGISFSLYASPNPLVVQEAAAAALSLEASVGGGRSLLQASHKEREKERQRGKEKPGVHSPVEFKVSQLRFPNTQGCIS